jgi:hypothetical protein
MLPLVFWRSWPTGIKRWTGFLLTAAALALVFYWWAYFFGESFTFGWYLEQIPETIQLPLQKFILAGFETEINYRHFLILGKFAGGEVQVYPWLHYSAWIFILIGLVVILAVCTTFPRFWFVFSMAIFIFLITTFEPAQLKLFGTSGNASLIIILVLLIGPAYYLNAFAENSGISFRILIMSAAVTLLIVLVHLFSGISSPAMYLTSQGILLPIVLSLIFIFFVAHEIIYLFLYLITRSNTINSKNSTLHFVAISSIYLAALLISILANIWLFEVGSSVVNAFFILSISAGLGFWNLLRRENLFITVLPSGQLMTLLYLGFALITLITIGIAFSTANDSLIESFEDLILFSHFAFGLTFFIYIIANFFNLLHENQKVYRVAFQPQRMPFFTYRLAGVIVVLAFFFQSGKISYEQALAGRFNFVGDYYLYRGNFSLASQFFQQGSQYGYNNHRSNYALAKLADYQEEENTPRFYFQRAIAKKPTAYAYLNLAREYEEQGKFFDALFTLREAKTKFPENGAVLNALGIIYSRTNLIDSAVYYLDQASGKSFSSEVASANLYAIMARHRLDESSENLQERFSSAEDLAAKANLLVLMNLNQATSTIADAEFLREDSTLNLEEFSFLNNLLLNQGNAVDNDLLDFATSTQQITNADYQGYLRLAAAYVFIDRLNISKALEIMQQQRYLEAPEPGYTLNLAGLNLLYLQEAARAADFLQEAAETNFPQDPLISSLAYVLAGMPEALQEQLNQFDSLPTEGFLSRIQKYLMEDQEIFSAGSDSALFYQSLIFQDRLSHNEQLKTFHLLAPGPLKNEFALYHVKQFIDNNQYDLATEFLNEAVFDDLHPYLEKELQQIRLLLHWKNNEFSLLKSNLNQEINPYFQTFYRGILASQSNDTLSVRLAYDSIAINNPFFEKGILEMSGFYHNHNQDLKAYQILLNAYRYNVYSPQILKAYITQSLKMGFTAYAEDALESYRLRVNESRYLRFKQEIDSVFVQFKQNNSVSW